MSTIDLNSISEYLFNEPDSAWGRSRFSEADIKMAFEIANQSYYITNEDISKQQKNSKSSKRTKDDLKRKRDEKRKAKEDRKNASIKDKRKGRKGTNDFDDTEDGDDLDSEWGVNSTNSNNDDVSEFSEEKKSESYEDSENDFDPFKLQMNLELSLSSNDHPSRDFSQFDAKIVMNIFQNLEFNEILACSKVCKYWKELSKGKDMWKEKFHKQESKMFENEKDVNMWEELGTNFEVKKFVKGKETSLNTLVAAVTPQAEVPDMMDVNTFLTTYQTFTTTKNLIRKLIQRYQVPEKVDGSVEEIKKFNVTVVMPIQLRVCKLLKGVIETHHQDIDKDLQLLLKLFVLGFVDQSILTKQLQSAISAFNTRGTSVVEEQISTDEGSSKKPTLSSIFELSSEEIARQLTLIEFETYESIKPPEFFGQAWAKPKTYDRAPNIRAMINRFNEITKWIVSEILNEEKIRNRVKRVVKFIKIAQSLRSMHNYHTLMAVLSGMGDGPIYRLKHTNAEIPAKYKQIYTELQDLMSANGSYNAYRAELASCQPPCIPYLGIYLRDLTYYDEGGSSSNGLINFKSKKNVYSVIQIIQKFQVHPYDFKKNERAYNSLKRLSSLDDEALFRISLLREPRESKRSDVQ